MLLSSLNKPEMQLSNVHKRVIADLHKINPRSSLHELAEKLNNMPEMMTCHEEITVALLKNLGYEEPEPAIGDGTNGTPDIDKDEGDTPAPSHRSLSVDVLRRQLEVRHAKIQARMEDLLSDDTLAASDLKTVDMLAKIDDGICSKLMDLMNQEAAPALPQAIIVACLRRMGVPDEEIRVIEEFKIA